MQDSLLYKQTRACIQLLFPAHCDRTLCIASFILLAPNVKKQVGTCLNQVYNKQPLIFLGQEEVTLSVVDLLGPVPLLHWACSKGFAGGRSMVGAFFLQNPSPPAQRQTNQLHHLPLLYLFEPSNVYSPFFSLHCLSQPGKLSEGNRGTNTLHQKHTSLLPLSLVPSWQVLLLVLDSFVDQKQIPQCFYY